MKDIPMQTGNKELDSQVEELADYLAVNCPDHYEAIVLFGRSRYLQGSIKSTQEAMQVVEGTK